MFDDGATETIVQNVVLEGTKNAALGDVGFEQCCIKRLDETRVDESDGQAPGFEQGFGALGHFEKRA